MIRGAPIDNNIFKFRIVLFKNAPKSSLNKSILVIGGGDDGNLRLAKLETKVETIIPTLATKGDVAEAKAGIIMWLAGVVIAATAIIISVLAFMLNRAVPPQSSSAPIVIYPQQLNPPISQSPPATKRDR